MSHHTKEKYFGGWILTTIIVVIFLAVLGNTIIPPLVTNATLADDEVVIGALLPLTGSGSNRGIAVQEGIELAIDELNKNGHNIRIEYRDTQSTGTVALENYFDLYDQGIRIFIGPVDSEETEAVAPFAEIYKTPLITFGTSATLAEYTNYIFKYSPSDKYLSSKISTESTTGNDGKKSGDMVKYAVVWAQNTFARSFYESVVENVNIQGHGEESNIDVISIPLTSIDSAVNKLIETDPDEVLVVPENPTQFSELLTKIYEAGACKKCFIMCTDSGYGDEIIENPASYGVSVICPKMFSNQEFENKFKERFNHSPNLYSANGYDAVNTLASVIYTRGSDASSVLNGLLNYRGEGVNGQIYFEPETLTRYPMYVIYTSYMGNWYTQDIFNYFHDVSEESLLEQKEVIATIQKAIEDGDTATVEKERKTLLAMIDPGAFTKDE